MFDTVNWDEEARNSDEAWRGDLENKGRRNAFWVASLLKKKKKLIN